MPAVAPLPIFEFERRLVGDLELIPLCVRFQLDAAGMRISLDDWQRLPYATRMRLIALPVDAAISGDGGARETPPSPEITDVDIGSDSSALLLRQLLSSAGLAPRHEAPEIGWMPGAERPPDAVDKQCAWAGVSPLSTNAWAALTPFQRYALAKISRRDRPNVDFLPALREFGLG